MNNATVNSNIEHKCQQQSLFYQKDSFKDVGYLNFTKKVQLYKEQLRKKHVSFYKGTQPDLKRMQLAKDTENYFLTIMKLVESGFFPTSSWKRDM